jgi:hypothetical protein
MAGSLIGICFYFASTFLLPAMILRLILDVRCRVVSSVARAPLQQQQQQNTAAGAAAAAAASAAINSLVRCEMSSTTRDTFSCYTQSMKNPYSVLNSTIVC